MLFFLLLPKPIRHHRGENTTKSSPHYKKKPSCGFCYPRLNISFSRLFGCISAESIIAAHPFKRYPISHRITLLLGLNNEKNRRKNTPSCCMVTQWGLLSRPWCFVSPFRFSGEETKICSKGRSINGCHGTWLFFESLLYFAQRRRKIMYREPPAVNG